MLPSRCLDLRRTVIYHQIYRMRATLLFTITALAAALCLIVPASRAASYTTNSFSDAFVTTGPATNNLSGYNFGGAGALSVAAPGLPNGEFQSVLQFNVSGALSALNAQFGAGQWAVQSVALQLTATPNNNPIFNTTAAGMFNVSLMANNSWIEGTGTPAAPTADGITFNSLQSTYINNALDQPAGTFSFNGASSGSADYSLTLGSALLNDIYTGGDVPLRLYAADSVVSYLFNSRSGGSSSSHPELIIVATPEPGTFALGALGLTIASGWRCARRLRK
jgi:hypothetical protein